ncbi:hypothetical protein M407DRAFT_8800 [Tulasnella calospora MUT 4182]|uniref:Uncharacterized protein n=1 Tax=Tulasnella calospora MUT 4182 TaxID=1051891 RepID=A0A0C3Q613_9AGAM|nr:hypothetical protein M407DRAFT_8800 [Tulasnella calospora MUT 4182]
MQHPAVGVQISSALRNHSLYPCSLFQHTSSEVMTFQLDKSWPTGLQTIFDHGRAKHSRTVTMDPTTNYSTIASGTIVPLADDWQDSADSLIPFSTVFDRNHKPVLLVEIRDDGWAGKAELHYRADKLMRSRYALMLDDCPIPRLWGLSILGTSMRVYCGVTASHEVVPPPIGRPEPSRVLLPSFLAEE